jgi:hypothetical protein
VSIFVIVRQAATVHVNKVAAAQPLTAHPALACFPVLRFPAASLPLGLAQDSQAPATPGCPGCGRAINATTRLNPFTANRRPALSTTDLDPPNRSPSGTVGPAVVLRKDKHAALRAVLAGSPLRPCPAHGDTVGAETSRG